MGILFFVFKFIFHFFRLYIYEFFERDKQWIAYRYFLWEISGDSIHVIGLQNNNNCCYFRSWSNFVVIQNDF